MRGSYEWAMLRLAVLGSFVLPALFMAPSSQDSQKAGSWLAAVEIAGPVLAIHSPSLPTRVVLPTAVVNEIKQSAVMASEAQQEAMHALRKELARELIRARSLKTDLAQRPAAKS